MTKTVFQLITIMALSSGLLAQQAQTEVKKITKFDQVASFEDLKTFLATVKAYDDKIDYTKSYLEAHPAKIAELPSIESYLQAMRTSISDDKKLRQSKKDRYISYVDDLLVKARIQATGAEVWKATKSAASSFANWLNKRAGSQTNSSPAASTAQTQSDGAPVKDLTK